MSPAKLASQPLPAWIGVGISIVTGLTAIGRGQDYITGSASEILAYLHFVGFQTWGWTLILAGMATLACQLARWLLGYIWPLLLMHLCLLFIYGGLLAALLQGDPWTDTGRRALLNCAAAAFFHFVRIFVLNREKNLARLLSVESG